MKRISLIIVQICIILSTGILARDWYVRPAGGNYGLENGTTYANAWDGLLNVKWGAGGVQPGDTLWVCGLHIHNMVNLQITAEQADIPITSGTSESARVIIRGDYPGDPGIVWGAYRMSYEAWTYEGNSVWSISLPGNQYPDWFFEDITATSWKVLDKASSLDACRSTPGSHYSADYTGGIKLYIHCSDSGNPTGRIYANRWGYDWKINGKHYITFLNLKMLCPYRFSWAGSGIVATHMKWEGCTLWYGEHSLICPLVDCHYWTVKNCDLAWANNGIYNVNQTSDYGSPNNYVYSGNTIHDMGVRPVTQNSDAHAIGIQGGHYGLMEGNYIYNCGSGITMYAFINQDMTNNIVRYNFVRDTHTYGGANSRGIETGCSNDSLSDKSGNKFYYNIVMDCEVGYRFQWEDEQEVYNNIAYNCDVGLASDRSYLSYGPKVKARNNIFCNSRTHHIYFLTNATDAYANFDFNLYYPDGPDKFKLWVASTTNFAGWQSYSRQGYIFDLNSKLADPLFQSPANENFQLQSSSPAIDAGASVGLSQDRQGTTIPQGFAPDIGAYESKRVIFARISATPSSGPSPLLSTSRLTPREIFLRLHIDGISGMINPRILRIVPTLTHR